MKKISFFIAALVLIFLLAGCASSAPQSSEPEISPAVSPVHTDSIEPVGSNDPLPEESKTPYVSNVDVNEHLTNIWNIMDNACVEEIPILPGLLLDDIEDWMDETPYKEIRLYQRTDWNTVRLGTFEDVAVARISMLKDDNFTGEEFSWNVRMEKSDKLENKTSIEIPEFADLSDTFVFDEKGNQVPGYYYFWENGDGTCTEIYIIYFEDSGNLYTFYTNETVFTQIGGKWVSNHDRSPSVCVSYIDDGPDAYKYINGDAMAAGVSDIRYFRIKTFEDIKTYQYRFGMTVREWVGSELNTDGWYMHPTDPDVAVSPDSKYRLGNTNDFVWRVMRASSNGIAGNNAASADDNYYALGSVHCLNSTLPMYIQGFFLHSQTFQDNFYLDYSNSKMWQQYGVNDSITFSGVGVTKENIADMEAFVVPHTSHDKTLEDIINDKTHSKSYGLPYNNDYNAVKSAGTSLALEYYELDDEALGGDPEYLKRRYSNGAFKTVYEPQNDPKFNPYRDVDICIAYKGEIVYWIFLPQFNES